MIYRKPSPVLLTESSGSFEPDILLDFSGGHLIRAEDSGQDILYTEMFHDIDPVAVTGKRYA